MQKTAMLWGLVLAGALSVGCSASTAAPAQTVGVAQWDPGAAAEAEAMMHRFHKAWDTMDVESVKAAIADDGFLTTFEINSANIAVRLSSKEELVKFLAGAFEEFKTQGATTDARPVVDMRCRATSAIAFCTEECDISVKQADGTVEVTPHRGTSVLRKGLDGWKFTHWHVSESGKKIVRKANEATVALDANRAPAVP